MNDSQISQYIIDTFKGVDVVVAMEASFFFYNPDPSVPPDHKFPFVTLVTSDLHDQFSDLNRPSVFRLNIGIRKETFHSLFGSLPLPTQHDDATKIANHDGNYDFTMLNRMMPHPVYGRMYWVCILNPSDETFAENVRPLLNEAYAMTVNKYEKSEQR